MASPLRKLKPREYKLPDDIGDILLDDDESSVSVTIRSPDVRKNLQNQQQPSPINNMNGVDNY